MDHGNNNIRNQAITGIIEDAETLLDEIILKGFIAFSNTALVDKLIKDCRWTGLDTGKKLLGDLKHYLGKNRKSLGAEAEQASSQAAGSYFMLDVYIRLMKNKTCIDTLGKKEVFNEK